jgi:hypothetical protein
LGSGAEFVFGWEAGEGGWSGECEGTGELAGEARLAGGSSLRAGSPGDCGFCPRIGVVGMSVMRRATGVTCFAGVFEVALGLVGVSTGAGGAGVGADLATAWAAGGMPLAGTFLATRMISVGRVGAGPWGGPACAGGGEDTGEGGSGGPANAMRSTRQASNSSEAL